MKISFIQSNITNCNNKAYKTPKQNAIVAQPKFGAKPIVAYTDLVNKNLLKIGKDISSEQEYEKFLDRIYNYKINDKEPLFDIEYNMHMYPKIKKEQEGLLLYAGYFDLSDDMNRFLSNRKMSKMTSEQARNVIRVFDYSLKNLDSTFGKYNGIVYRQGFFPNNQHQYISTTTDPIIAATLRGGIFMNKNLEFSIVNVKNGHKINDFQRKMSSSYAEEEEEIVLSRKSAFKEIINPKGQYLILKNKFHKILETYAHREVSPNKITIFEEI